MAPTTCRSASEMAVTVTNYDTVNGKIRTKWTGERPGSQAVFHDPLGSVVGIYEDGWLKADRVYDASGETRAEWNDVGTFGWVGGYGYRETRREWVSHYVRARHYSYMTGGWTSVDPLWPGEMAYGYVDGRGTAMIDPSGRKPPIVRNQPPKPSSECNYETKGDTSRQRGITYLGSGVTQGGVSLSISASGSVNISPFGIGGQATIGVGLGYSSRIVCTEVAMTFEDFECQCKIGPKGSPCFLDDCSWVSKGKQECKGQYCVEKIQVSSAVFVLWEHFKPYSNSPSGCKASGELVIDDQAIKRLCESLDYTPAQCEQVLRFYRGGRGAPKGRPGRRG